MSTNTVAGSRWGVAKWGPLDAAYEYYACSMNELARWLRKGLVYGHFRRGGKGWLIQLSPPAFNPEEIRIREGRQG